MFNLLQKISLLLASAVMGWSVYAQDVTTMVKNADQFRLDSDAAKVVTLVSLFEHGQLDKTRQYNVYTRKNRDSLVMFKSQVEAGQKMLMLDDNYWLVMPKSRRPIRITPMQKLLGEASVGDISTLTWSEDYQPSWISAETLMVEGQAMSVNHLNLIAVTPGASYQKIELWLDQNDDFPLKANLYLRSGKLAKQAWFDKGERDGKTRVTAMTLLDQIQPAKKTLIEYQSITPMVLDEKYYNPAYLVRNALSEL